MKVKELVKKYDELASKYEKTLKEREAFEKRLQAARSAGEAKAEPPASPGPQGAQSDQAQMEHQKAEEDLQGKIRILEKHKSGLQDKCIQLEKERKAALEKVQELEKKLAGEMQTILKIEPEAKRGK